MALNWKRVALDVLIIFGLTLVGGFVIGIVIGALGASGVGVTPNTMLLASAITNLFLVCGGFAYSAYKTVQNRWAHLVAVGAGIWILSLINVVLGYSKILEWVIGIIPIGFFILIGGSIGVALAKRKKPAALSAVSTPAPSTADQIPPSPTI